MIDFQEHDRFEKEFKKMASKETLRAFQSLKRILDAYFHPTAPNKTVIGPGKIHRRKILQGCEVWKVEMFVKGLRQNQAPRVWFAVSANTIVFLCIYSHIVNYNDNEIDRIAIDRATDYF